VAWIQDCGHYLEERTMWEFFILWEALSDILLNLDQDDMLVWWWTMDGKYLAIFGMQGFICVW
jgi:hypothetical protein